MRPTLRPNTCIHNDPDAADALTPNAARAP